MADAEKEKQLNQTKQVVGVVGGLLYALSQGSFPLDVYPLAEQGRQFLLQFKDQLVKQIPADAAEKPTEPVVPEVAANAAPQA